MQIRSSTSIAILLFAVASGGCAATQTPAPCAAAPGHLELTQLSNEQLARKLIDLLGAGKLGQQMADAMSEKLRTMPGLPAGFIDRFQANIHPQDFVDMVIPIYLKNYDHDTLIAAIEFYSSEHGQALVTKLPVVSKEAMDAGSELGKKIAEQTLSEMGLSQSPPPQGH